MPLRASIRCGEDAVCKRVAAVRENQAGLREIVKLWKWKGEPFNIACSKERNPPPEV
jgi:hypothetical protein